MKTNEALLYGLKSKTLNADLNLPKSASTQALSQIQSSQKKLNSAQTPTPLDHRQRQKTGGNLL